jgi:hypothetical protein
MAGDWKSISKRLRFEIFKRDEFQCRYCGRTPPAVVLQIDHIEPVAKGGDNDPLNLATACEDCNQGKHAVPLSQVPPSLDHQQERYREAEEQLQAFNRFRQGLRRRIKRDVARLDKDFSTLFPDKELSGRFKLVTLENFLQSFDVQTLSDNLSEAYRRMAGKTRGAPDPESFLKYFCGICWTQLRRRESDG